MVKKKSKYRNVVINKKRYYFYKIEWLDILGDSGHADNNDEVFSDRNVYPIGCIKKMEKILL